MLAPVIDRALASVRLPPLAQSVPPFRNRPAEPSRRISRHVEHAAGHSRGEDPRNGVGGSDRRGDTAGEGTVADHDGRVGRAAKSADEGNRNRCDIARSEGGGSTEVVVADGKPAVAEGDRAALNRRKRGERGSEVDQDVEISAGCAIRVEGNRVGGCAVEGEVEGSAGRGAGKGQSLGVV